MGDGSSLSYTNWFGSGNPISPANTNVNCVKKQSNQNGQWNDIGCSKELNYACSMAAADSCATTTTTTTTTTACNSTYSYSDSDFTMSGSSCFYVSTDLATQEDAVTACEAKGAILATISDADQQTDVAAMITDDAWIGLNDIAVDETFEWQDGSSASYTNWFGTGNPISPANTNVNCVKMQFSKSGQWNDIGCSKELYYVCSMDVADSCDSATTLGATAATTTTTTTTTTSTTTTTTDAPTPVLTLTSP